MLCGGGGGGGGGAVDLCVATVQTEEGNCSWVLYGLFKMLKHVHACQLEV